MIRLIRSERARIDENLKRKATAILTRAGSCHVGFRAYRAVPVVSEQGPPFDMQAPNRLTAATLPKARQAYGAEEIIIKTRLLFPEYGL